MSETFILLSVCQSKAFKTKQQSYSNLSLRPIKSNQCIPISLNHSAESKIKRFIVKITQEIAAVQVRSL